MLSHSTVLTWHVDGGQRHATGLGVGVCAVSYNVHFTSDVCAVHIALNFNVTRCHQLVPGYQANVLHGRGALRVM
jgi:hypothetical protein